jgi:hypothetical protein
VRRVSYLSGIGALSGIALLVLLAVPNIARMQTKRPISKNGLIEALKINGLTTKELIRSVLRRGVAFQMTPSDEEDLRAAGARDALILAIRYSNYRSRELAKSRKNLLDATKEYKASLEKLLPFEEANVRNAANLVERRKQQRAEGGISNQELEDTKQALADAQARLEETRRQIDEADLMVSEALAMEALANVSNTNAGNANSRKRPTGKSAK